MQGQLRKKTLHFNLTTECGHCREPLHITLDSDLHYAVEEPGAAPLVFVPLVDFQKLEEPSIIDSF